MSETDKQPSGDTGSDNRAAVERQEQPAAAGEPLPRLRFRSPITGVPVVGFTGINGAGKTALAVSCAIADLAVGRPVYSTVDIDSPWGKSKPIKSLRQLLEIRNATVLIDEVSVVFSSRESMSVPQEVDVFLQTMRHQGVTLFWTAPAWMRADKRLREVTQVSCNVVPIIRVAKKGEFWPRPVFVGLGVQDVTQVKLDETPTRVMKRRLYRLKKLPAIGHYDSLAQVSRIGMHSPNGVCPDCGGRRPLIKCEPARHKELGVPW